MIGVGRPKFIRPQPQLTECGKIPAPILGINAQTGLSEMRPEEAIFLNNMFPSRYGVKVRNGYQEFATNVGTEEVRTILPYVGSAGAQDKLFACAQDAIYDISAGGSAPSDVHTFATADANSGYGGWTQYVTNAGHFLIYCDETNGYQLYTESTGLWSTVAMGGGAGQINGVDPADFVFAMTWKSRLWFIERNSGSAWYLPVGSITGSATQFNFGNKFKHGGTLVALFNWTIDGGEGIDDYLVAISSSGDIVIYKGTDPDVAANFVQHGSWYIGSTPAGRRIAGSFGGELYILSAYGLIPLTKLIAGANVQQQDIYISRKINPLINELMKLVRTDLGWEVKLVPGDNLLMISTPKRTGFPHLQFVQALNTDGWATFNGIPYNCSDVWLDNLYIGDSDNKVYKYIGNKDGVDLDDDGGVDIEWNMLQSFQDSGSVGTYKRGQLARPVFIANAAPAYSVELRYDYNLTEIFSAISSLSVAGALWDQGLWDTALWSVELSPVDNLRGVTGIGRTIAVGLRGSSSAETILVRTDLMRDEGGLL